VLDHPFLATVTERMGETVIYADRCALSAARLKQLNITFKKIPRDISRL
jgi:adenine-specific DNA-methyltransferase